MACCHLDDNFRDFFMQVGYPLAKCRGDLNVMACIDTDYIGKGRVSVILHKKELVYKLKNRISTVVII